MKKRKKRKPNPTVAPSGGKTDASPPVIEAERRNGRIWRDLLRGLLFTVLILGLKVVIEHTSLGKQIELAGYISLQQRLKSESDTIQIVDISDLEISETKIQGRSYRATPRDVLANITQAIADQNPRVIGVDIDFSPDADGYITPRVPDFFQSSAGLNVPIFLGIHRTQALPPDVWLGDPKFAGLAANIIIPKDSTKMPIEIQTNANSTSGLTMSAALAGALQKAHCAVGEFLSGIGLAKRVSTKELGAGGRVAEILVDYGPLDRLMSERLKTTNPAVIRDQGRLLANKIVLVGDGTLGKGSDTFVIPGQSQPIPGVYLHACAAYTLTKMPLYELNGIGRLVIDVLLVSIVLFSVAAIKFGAGKEQARVATERLRSIFIFVVIVVAIVVGVVFVYETCVMWSDFLLATGALVLHPAIERRLESTLEFIKRRGPQATKAVVFKGDDEELK